MWQLGSNNRTFLPRLGGAVTAIAPSAADPAQYTVAQADNTVRLVSLLRHKWKSFPFVNSKSRIQLQPVSIALCTVACSKLASVLHLVLLSGHRTVICHQRLWTCRKCCCPGCCPQCPQLCACHRGRPCALQVNMAAMTVETSVYGVRPAPPVADSSDWRPAAPPAMQPATGYLVLPAANTGLQFYDALQDRHVALLQVRDQHVACWQVFTAC